jgi:hypothetical protein
MSNHNDDGVSPFQKRQKTLRLVAIIAVLAVFGSGLVGLLSSF